MIRVKGVERDVFLTDNVPESTYHVFSNHKEGTPTQMNSFALSSYTKNGHHYSLVQINSNGSNLVFPKGIQVSSTLLSANKTKIMVIVIPEGKKNYVPLMITLDNFGFEQASLSPNHSLSVDDTHLVASYAHFVPSNNTVVLTHTVTKFNLNTGKVEKKWSIGGLLNLRVTHDTQGNFYMSGSGTSISVNGKSVDTTGISNYIIMKIDNKNTTVWTLTADTTNGLLSNNAIVNASSINQHSISNHKHQHSISNHKHQHSISNHKDHLLVTGSFFGSISLDKTYTIASTLKAMWWGEVSPGGKWIRSGILGPPVRSGETLSEGETGGNNPFHIRGTGIFGWGEDVHVVGTYRGNVSKELNSDQKRSFYHRVGVGSKSIDTNISSPNYISPPQIKLINGSLLIGAYFDSFFTLGNIRYRNKGTHGLIIFPAPLQGEEEDNSIVKYIELGGAYGCNNFMSGENEILSSNNVSIPPNLNYAHFSTYQF